MPTVLCKVPHLFSNLLCQMKCIEGVKFTNYFNDSADVIFAPETCFCETQTLTLTRQTTLFVKALRSSFFVSALVYMCCCTVCSSNEITQLEDRKRNRRSPRPDQKKVTNDKLKFDFFSWIYLLHFTWRLYFKAYQKNVFFFKKKLHFVALKT